VGFTKLLVRPSSQAKWTERSEATKVTTVILGQVATTLANIIFQKIILIFFTFNKMASTSKKENIQREREKY